MPNTGSTGGLTPISITGTGLQRGATVRFGGVDAFVYDSGDSTDIPVESPPHSPGTVDIEVVNRDGQSRTLSAAFRYALPGSFDFNGEWGHLSHETPLRFTIQGNVMTSFSCNLVPVTVSPLPSVVDGAFSFTISDGASVSGAIVSADDARGMINMPSVTFCGPGPWRSSRIR